MFKFIRRQWQKRRERFYQKNSWHLILDFSLALIIIILAAMLISFYAYRPVVNTQSVINIPKKNELDLNNPPLIINFELASSSLHLADSAELRLKMRNTSKFLVENIKINLLVIDQNFNIDKLEEISNSEPDSKTEISNSEISFGKLQASENREVVYKVYFSDKTETNRLIKWQAQSEYNVEGQTIKETFSIPGISLAAELSARAVAYYNSPQGDQLGSGPLPPAVALPTNYWVFFEVKSSGDFNNLVFSAKLPKGVELTDRRSVLAGDFKYNESSRQIIWKVVELKNQSDSYRVGFEVQFIPNALQLGKVVNLLTGINYYAEDTLINDENTGTLNNLDTNLNFDRINRGQGEVVLP
ncbi:MAG: hypothetical protein WCN88_01535 [Candidatus Falkowbacteria bacterium]